MYLTFGEALANLKKGKKLARKCWVEKNVYIKLVKGQIIPNHKDKGFNNDNGDLVILEHIDMFNERQQQVVGWTATQEDILSCDWTIVF